MPVAGDGHRGSAAVPTADPAGPTRVVAPAGPRVLLSLLLWLLAGSVLAGWLGLAAVHYRDDYRVGHLQGVWVATTAGAAAGALYPPLFDGQHYAGTRYLPLPILANAAAARLAGDPYEGGRLLAVVLMAGLLAVMVGLLRRMACPWPVTAGLAAACVATDVGLQAGTTIGGDLLAVGLQVAALAAYERRAARGVLAPAVLAGLAVASKLTGFWALLALVAHLALRAEWRRAATLAAVAGGVAAAVLLAVEAASGGGLSDHLLTFAFANVRGLGALVRGPNQLLYNLLGHASATVVLLPLAGLGVLLVRRSSELAAVHLALIIAMGTLVLVYADLGTGPNQLLDVVVLTALAVGQLAGAQSRVGAPSAGGAVVLLVVAVTTTWAVGVDLVRTVALDARAAVATLSGGDSPGHAAARVAARVAPGESVLAEDPAIAVALGRRPVVMDPFMVGRLDRLRPELVEPLVSWIAARRFGLVVLIVPLDDRSLDYWWRDFHFGDRVAAALRENYQPAGTSGRYFLYRPRG